MYEGILGSLITAIIITGFSSARRAGLFEPVIDFMLFYISKTGKREEKLLPGGVTNFQRKLLRFILKSQSRIGVHIGEYGKSSNSTLAKKWQSKKSREKTDLKPRMYLTAWPVYVLRKHDLAAKSINQARKGVSSLFINNRIPLHVVKPGPTPFRGITDFNHRHSMAGAFLLHGLGRNSRISKGVVGSMLDRHNSWQDSSGGWFHTSEEGGKPDLWASVHALKLLSSIRMIYPELTEKEYKLAELLELTTVQYLETKWDEGKWAIKNYITSEENVPIMFIELSEILKQKSPKLFAATQKTMHEWMSPVGTLTESYLNVVQEQKIAISAQQAYARFAYACYLSSSLVGKWEILFEKALEYRTLEKMFSSDWAFLLDLSYAYKEQRN